MSGGTSGSKNALVAIAVLAGLTVAGLTLYYTRSSGPQTEQLGALVPSMSERVNDAALIELTQADRSVTVRRSGEAWGVDELGGYPASFEHVKPALVGLGLAERLETRTARAENHAALGLAAPQEGSTAVGLIVREEDGQPLAELVLGDQLAPLPRSDDGVAMQQRFVRAASEDQTYLAAFPIIRRVDPLDWVEPNVTSIAQGRVKRVTTRREGEAAVTIERPSSMDQFVLIGDDAGASLVQNADRRLRGALAFLRFNRVRPADDPAWAEAEGGPKRTGVFQLFDGTRVSVELRPIGEDWYAALRSEYLPEERVEAEGERIVDVETVQQRLDGFAALHGPWLYRFREGLIDNLCPPREEIVQRESAGDEESVGEGPLVPEATPVPSEPEG
ncbi:MAG: DUF4340 domain-containing protein [Planctomycetota bacterium]